jgi:hypothetical protein
MSPFSAYMAVTSDYLYSATDLHVVVGGSKGSWHPKVRGSDPKDGGIVGVAYYDNDYDTKAEAGRRANQLLNYVVELRQASDRVAEIDPATTSLGIRVGAAE